MLPKGVDPLFPNKRLMGYDAYGRPIYDMAATGLTGFNTWGPSILWNRGSYFNIEPEVLSDEQMRATNQHMNERAKRDE